MKHFLTLLLHFIILTAFSQGNQEERPAMATSFPDSVRIVLENSRYVDAQVVGTSFFTAWSSLDPGQQNQIKLQAKLMKKKGYKLRPFMVNYYGAIADAVSIEKANPSTLSEYLEVCQQMIDTYDDKRAAAFFGKAKTFFQHHALHFEKTLRLYASNDEYHFEFIGPPPSMFDESTGNTDSNTEDSYVEDTYSDDTSNDSYDNYQDTYTDNYSDEPVEEPIQEVMPFWMTPPPQPSVEGPVIRFEKLTLNMVTRYDSIFIENTKGTYSIGQTLFVGDGGKFDWTPAGLPADSVYCTLGEYHFSTNRSTITSDLVKLHYMGRLSEDIPGNFEFKSQNRKDSALSSYPRFISYQNTIKQNIGVPDISFIGGFSLLGNKITSQTVSGDPSLLEVSHEGQPRFSGKSASFQFQDSLITGSNVSFKIYQMNDSIVHPNVRLRYDFGKEKLVVQHDKGSMHYTPYSSSYFSMDFSADLIRWDLKSDSLNLLTQGGRGTDPIVVESADYYDAEDFRLLKGQGFSFHPVVLVSDYCFKNKVREFYVGNLANYYKKDVNEVRAAMEFLAQKGLIIYEPKTQFVKVKNKTIELYWAYKGESDYDNIKIHSVIDSLPNATINYKKGYMTVRGVEQFRVSDSLNVMIDPDSSIVTLLQNRDIKFDGTIDAGNFQISGKGFTLKYDSFFINLTQIDSINFYVTEMNAYGQKVRRKISNSMVGADSTAAAAGGLGDISQSSGTLYISKANNKSGKRKIPNYPRLDATTGGVIYFDREEVLSGVYDRSMFFVIPPFKIDSLNDADPASINFDGTFVSSGMFPNFKEKLHTMPDKSLGFEHAIPKPGYNLYNGEAVMNGALSLNNRGLRGGGKINYLAATIYSPDFVFYPDSVIARGQRAKIAKQQFGNVLFPQASLPEYEMKWYPKQDQMKLKNLRDPFHFYDSTAQLNGKITISKNGVAGEGKLDTRGTELLSKDIQFTGNSFSARNAKFKVNSNDPQKPLMFGNNIRLKFNLDENSADISPEVEGEAAINFPYAQVKTSMPNARWDLQTQKITMTKREDVALENSYFYSTRKELDSLYFNAEKAEYDMKTQELKVSGIPYIVVADAKITPENNEVLILENSRIGTLKNTTIVLDTLNGYHRLTEGVVDIVSRKEFTGYATYQYVNFLKDTFAIKMTDFHLEPIIENDALRKSRRKSEATLQTVAKGVVEEKEHLILGGGMFYKGDITMYATRPALQLSGYVKLDLKNIPNYNTWIEYNQTGDEAEVMIDFDNAITEDGKRVRAGLHFSEKNDMYITFLNDKQSEDDDDLFVPSGSLFFDPESKEYKIEDKQKSAGNKLSGKAFSYNDQTRKVTFEGPISLFKGTEDFNLQASCLGSGNLETNEIKLNALVVMNTNIPSAAFDAMGRDIANVVKNEGADEGLGDPTELLYKVADIVGEKTAKSYEEKSLISYVSLGEIPALAKPLVISNVNLKWSDEQKAFYSEGNIGVSNILRNDINGGFEGFMEVKRSVEGDPIFNLFIKASPDSWYYFGFEGRRILAYSSNNEFNNIIGKKTNAGKAKIGEVAFVPGSEEETLAFINYFRSNYYGIESPYNLTAPSSAAKRRIEAQPNEVGQPVETKEDKENKPDDDGF